MPVNVFLIFKKILGMSLGGGFDKFRTSYARSEGLFAEREKGIEKEGKEVVVKVNGKGQIRSCVYLKQSHLYLKRSRFRMDIVVCEHTFRAGSFFTYRKHRVLPNI